MGSICYFSDLVGLFFPSPPFAALCPNPPPVKKITQEDIKVMLYLLEEVGTTFPTQASSRP